MSGTQGYGENAEALAEQYESIAFADVHRDVLHLVPTAASRVLDIGAGSGRDAAALAGRGHTLVAVEPTAALRAEGTRRHAGAAIEWIDDQLPEPSLVRARGERFDLIMLTAVWMHLDRAERQSAMRALQDLLEEGGRTILSLRHGPVPAGRRMFDVSAAETIDLAAASGLRCIHRNERDDMLGRPDVRWSFVAFER